MTKHFDEVLVCIDNSLTSDTDHSSTLVDVKDTFVLSFTIIIIHRKLPVRKSLCFETSRNLFDNNPTTVKHIL